MSQIERFIETVDEEMREDRVRAFWLENRGAILGGLVVFFVGLVGSVAWQGWRDGRDREAAGLYLDAMRAEEPGAAIQKFDEVIVRFGGHGYASLARLNKAGRLADTGKTDEAAAELEALAGQTGVDPLLSQLALLNAAYLAKDRAKAATLLDGLPKNSPFLPAALEWKGMAALEKGDEAAALVHFREALSLNPDGSLQGRLSRRVEELELRVDQKQKP